MRWVACFLVYSTRVLSLAGGILCTHKCAPCSFMRQQGNMCKPVDSAHGKKTYQSVFDAMVCPVPFVRRSGRPVTGTLDTQSPRLGEKPCNWGCARQWDLGSWDLLKVISFPPFLATQFFVCHVPWQNAVSCVKVEQLFYTYIHLQGQLESLEVSSRCWGSS